MIVVSILLSLIFLILSILHLNWAIGNTWGLKYAVPTKSDSEELFSIFLLRAIGDFNYVGFFKKIKDTNFGKMDSKYYSPLCLVIAIMGFAVKFL